MKLLLDSHAFIRWDSSGAGLSVAACRVIADPINQIFVSAVSVWEIAIKRRLGKPAFEGSPAAAIGANGFFELVVTPADGEAAGGLDWRHKDPFDKLLVAQAIRFVVSRKRMSEVERGGGRLRDPQMEAVGCAGAPHPTLAYPQLPHHGVGHDREGCYIPVARRIPGETDVA